MAIQVYKFLIYLVLEETSLSFHEWPIPKVFRIANNKKVIKGIFEGSTINTPSMICVEDALDGLIWAEENGGLEFLLNTSKKSLDIIYNWVQKNDWVTFLSNNKNM